DIFERSADAMRRAGYRQYEVSAWARPDAVCRHNYNYWTFGDYLAIGAGAHAKLTSADGHITRRARQRWPRAYMAAAGTPAMLSASHQLDFGDRSFEFLLNGLRLKDGVSREQYETRTGLGWNTLGEHLAGVTPSDLLCMDDTRLRASDRGWYYLDTILSQVLPDA